MMMSRPSGVDAQYCPAALSLRAALHTVHLKPSCNEQTCCKVRAVCLHWLCQHLLAAFLNCLFCLVNTADLVAAHPVGSCSLPWNCYSPCYGCRVSPNSLAGAPQTAAAGDHLLAPHGLLMPAWKAAYHPTLSSEEGAQTAAVQSWLGHCMDCQLPVGVCMAGKPAISLMS